MASSWSGTALPDDDDGARVQWVREAFQDLCGQGLKLTYDHLTGRMLASWFRDLVADTVLCGALLPTKVLRTSRIIALLSAKAGWNDGRCLSFGEFDSFVRVIMFPSPDLALEAQLTWALVDSGGDGKLRWDDAVGIVRDLWSSVGVPCQEEDADQVSIAAKSEDGGWLTPDRYKLWFETCQQGQTRSLVRSRRTPREVASAAAATATFTDPLRPVEYIRCVRSRDQVLRSTETCTLSLSSRYDGDRALNCSEVVRSLTPSRPSCAKRRTDAAIESISVEMPEALQSIKSTTAPGGWQRSALVRIKTEDQDAWWVRNHERLQPYMRVKVSHRKADGSKAESIGTLLSGWGIPNKTCVLPHCGSPKSPRRKQVQETQQAGMLPALRDAEKFQDIEQFVTVEINGAEKLVPRECVKPLS